MPISGLSVLTPPAQDDAEQKPFYAHLLRMRDRAMERFSARFHAVNAECLHVTVADLISGSHYSTSLERCSSLNTAICDRLAFTFSQQRKVERPIAWQIAGLAFFQHALVCLLAPASELDYVALSELREDIYNDSVLKNLGIRRPRPFMAHITLAYYEDFPSQTERAAWAYDHGEMQREVLDYDLPFLIHRIDLRTFEDMTAFELLSPRVGLSFGEL